MKRFIIIVNRIKWVLQNIPKECPWHERWLVWGYVVVSQCNLVLYGDNWYPAINGYKAVPFTIFL